MPGPALLRLRHRQRSPPDSLVRRQLPASLLAAPRLDWGPRLRRHMVGRFSLAVLRSEAAIRRALGATKYIGFFRPERLAVERGETDVLRQASWEGERDARPKERPKTPSAVFLSMLPLPRPPSSLISDHSQSD